MSDGGGVAADLPPQFACLIVISARFVPESANFDEKWLEMAAHTDGADRALETLKFQLLPRHSVFLLPRNGGSLVSMNFGRPILLLA